MSYEFQPGRLYRMPTHFGPSLGPRQGPGGRTYAGRDTPKVKTVAVSFLSNAHQLAALLPPGFVMGSQPVVTVSATYMTQIEWLAGRGYNTLGVSFPARFEGERDRVSGDFLAVLWESLADPIITGREELGFSKVYCELPEPSEVNGQTHCRAEWMGFAFLELKVRNLKAQNAQQIEAFEKGQTSEGRLHYKYIPRTGQPGAADAAYAVLTPAAIPNRVIRQRWTADGTVAFRPSKWEDLPTLHHIVSALAGLEVRQAVGASVANSTGLKDFSDQRILQ